MQRRRRGEAEDFRSIDFQGVNSRARGSAKHLNSSAGESERERERAWKGLKGRANSGFARPWPIENPRSPIASLALSSSNSLATVYWMSLISGEISLISLQQRARSGCKVAQPTSQTPGACPPPFRSNIFTLALSSRSLIIEARPVEAVAAKLIEALL